MVILLRAAPIVLYGTVSDPDGWAVPDAQVTLFCHGSSESVKTDLNGRFAFPSRTSTAGCEIAVEREGFAVFKNSLDSDASVISAKLSLEVVKEVVDVAGRELDPIFNSGFGSRSFSGKELRTFSNDTSELIRYAKLRAGASPIPDAIYVDGLEGGPLPAANEIERITVNADPFSAEFADGDMNRIQITTKSPDRTFRYGLGGLSLGSRVRNSLDPSLFSKTTSASGFVSGPVPRIPVTFSLRGNFGSNQDQMPILAVGPPEVYASKAGVRVSSRFGSGSLNLDYFAAQRFRVHVAMGESRFSGSNLGAGGLTLPEAAARSNSNSAWMRSTIAATAESFVYQGGLLFERRNSDSHANSTVAGVTVEGAFVAGGAPMTATESHRSTWTWKNVFQSTTDRKSWAAGLIVAGSNDSNDQTPNSSGSFQFSSLQEYTDALTGLGTGTWLLSRGNGMVRYVGTTAAPFIQKELMLNEHFLILGGVRADYQSGYRTLFSPRLSLASQWRGFVWRSGWGLFVRPIPSAVFVTAMQADGTHLEQFVQTGVSFPPNPLTGTWASSGPGIHERLAPDLTRPRESLFKSSVEKAFGRLTPGVEYTWSRDRHLLGVRRLTAEGGWSDLIESNRDAEVHRVSARLRYVWKTQMLSASYDYFHSRDDGSGLMAFPAQQGNLQAEWARSSGISPRNLTLVGLFHLPAAVSLTATDSWRSSAPYNITTGLDPANDGLYTDRGGRPRNSGNGPSYNSLAVYLSKRVEVPVRFTGRHRRLSVDLGLQGDNLLNSRNYLAFGSVVGAPTLGQPLAAGARRSIRLWLNFN